MQFLVIMKADPQSPKERLASLQRKETVEAWEMTKADVLRALWYIPSNEGPIGTVAILECASQKEAEAYCSKFPFVVNGVVSLELIALSPCTAYEMLFAALVD